MIDEPILNTTDQPHPPESGLDRAAFAAASSTRRRILTDEWMRLSCQSFADTEVVRRIRERDLADARAQFGPFLTMTAILFAMFTLSLNQGTLPLLVLAGGGMLIALFGAWHAFRSMMTTSRQLASLDIRTADDREGPHRRT